ncbi:MAG: hypothetical protein KIT86_05565 [Hydrogenophaga sp.]|jgi:hemerythrin|uniref:bacteriohemerythrin n=1 Tax=Hydrogenophaga sp. TaxID=1904254 RepID=UPI002608BA45|nr:hemerythrin domain-containing protein [Hydrogenophaga sp.]MCW5669108.1 hypothetical protein [Hydrogenophaga sp.]
MSTDLHTFMDRNEHLTGDDRMDRVHEEFHLLLLALRAAPADQAATALLDLITHTRDHFAQEDTWMRDLDYPIRDCHIQEHAEVLASLVQVHERLCQNDHRALPRLIHALEDWFPGHVQHLDSALAQWMVRRQWNAQPIMLRRNAASPTP